MMKGCVHMAKHGTRYPEEFKRQIVDLYHAGTPVTKLANEYGLVEQTIYKWIKNYSPIVEQEDGSTVSMKDYKELQKKLEKYRDIFAQYLDLTNHTNDNK